MKYFLPIIFLLLLVASCKEDKKARILVFSKTKGFRHESIGPGKLALIKLGTENNFEVDTTEDASVFNEENLKRYNAIVFLSTTQDILDPVQQNDFKRFIEAGGGFVGIHAAADTEYDWPWYGKLVGAYFRSHPQIQEAKLRKVRSFGPNTLPETWVRTDEWYNYKNISKDINVIYTLDETSYQGGENGNDHPIAWYHEFQGGRVFYTGLGHTNESYTDSLFLQHVLHGIQYAVGEKQRLDYEKVKTKRAPEESRFTKTVLDFNLEEPTELAVLPDSRILFVERKGSIKLYTPEDGKVKLIDTLNVWTKFEDGIIGLAADPDFARNNYVYMFYSHPEKSANVVSRFSFVNNRIDFASEKQIIEVTTQRDKCCHTGGSLQFGPDRNLFISTGDNTSPFESDGFSPSDEQKGREPFDAQKSSSNTNDLRGKILRIKVAEDGTYSIPEGNLFPPGEDKTRPEIYVMGNRNPYRISVDKRTGFLYWGEVGPDAGEDDPERGPRGYDEINQARKAGFFGWPYFVGNNYAYARHDFASGKTGPKWDPAKPFNDSPNNTGKRELPPASPAFIWYPYAKSEQFPMVKEGGRNAMAGPVYYSSDFKNVKTAFPDYFDGKILVYDWMRNWMFLVTTDEQGDLLDMEPFMPNTRFNNIIDLQYGGDGRLYMLEYGTAWFKQNMDARLVRIDYNGGNRAPVVQLAADKLAGGLPMTVQFSSEGSKDYDGDKLKYELNVAGKTLSSEDGKFSFTFEQPGSYNVKLTATDPQGVSNSAQLVIIAGNEPPVVKVEVEGNKSFFFPGTPVKYSVNVTDREDGSSSGGKIGEGLKVTFNYLKGFDRTGIAQGHQMAAVELPGKTLIENSDCKSCHLIDQKSAGPSYRDVADKYKGQAGAADRLAAKIIKGGAGVWGTTEMAAHPQISIEDARRMVDYILSLGTEKDEKSLPLSGSVVPGQEKDGAYILTASYNDNGSGKVPSLSSADAVALSAPFLKADKASSLRNAGVVRVQGKQYLGNIRNESHAVYKNIDLKGVKTVKTGAIIRGEDVGGVIELRLDKPDGKLLGSAKINGSGNLEKAVSIAPESGIHDLFVVFRNVDAANSQLFVFTGLQLSNK